MQEYRTIFKGIVSGGELYIRHPMIKPQENDDILVWNGKSIQIDLQNLPPSLTRLIPNGYVTPHCKAANWERFITQARLLGRL